MNLVLHFCKSSVFVAQKIYTCSHAHRYTCRSVFDCSHLINVAMKECHSNARTYPIPDARQFLALLIFFFPFRFSLVSFLAPFLFVVDNISRAGVDLLMMNHNRKQTKEARKKRTGHRGALPRRRQIRAQKKITSKLSGILRMW